MSDLTDLYGEVILDHCKKPRNFRLIPDATHKASGANPLCGDHIQVYLKLDGDKIADIGFLGNGCAISRAAASIMTQELIGKTKLEAEELFRKYHAMVTRDMGKPYEGEDLGKLAIFAGVAEFPVRVKCATLSWHAMEAALKGGATTVSTE
ncbi:MAG: SUF system NifU family Fe-S cluster assembly protein [Planctomycetes bacterium]|nr:SUF system NifU family Fe-S cluster assembly protein [Planctomycetota bacterium]